MNPERKFVGGIKKVTPENIYEREKAGYQMTEIFGLNENFLNRMLVLQVLIEDYKEAAANKKRPALRNLVDYVGKLEPYEEYLKPAIPPETHPAVFADDVKPYIQAIDEIVIGIKELGQAIDAELQRKRAHSRLKPMLLALESAALTVDRIIHSKTNRLTTEFTFKNDLLTEPIDRKFLYKQDSLPESEALEKIRMRLGYAKSLLEKGPLEGGFSHMLKDKNVVPIDWEPTAEDEKRLGESDIK